LVRPQALDAVPVGAVRRRGVAPGEARNHQARRAPILQRPRASREPARGSAPGAARPGRPARRRFSGAGGFVRRGLAPSAPGMGGGRRVLYDTPPVHRRADAVGSLRCRRQEGRTAPRVGAGARGERRRGRSALMMVQDTFQRRLRNLRISVTDRCNLRCAYCMPEEDYVWLPREQILHFEEVSALADVFMDLGVDKIRLTGGEPLLRRDVDGLIRLLAAKPRLRDLAITTNGVLLAEQARALKAAGLHRVTVSLDTLRPDRFARLTRRSNHAQVLAGIGALPAAGFTGTKLDTVVMRGVNDDELADLIEFGKTLPAEVRFIEYMDVGGATQWSMEQVVSRAEVLGVLGRRYGRIEPVVEESTAPADRYALTDGTVFGIISSTTEPFCASCDRSRLTADGVWYLCLYAQSGVDLRGPLRRGVSRDELTQLIADTWKRRTDRGAEQRLRLRDRTPLV